MNALAPARVLGRNSGLMCRSQFLLRGLSRSIGTEVSTCLLSSKALRPHSSRGWSAGSDRTGASVRWFSAPSTETEPSFAFCFDIDGVLLHKSSPIPGAVDTLQYLRRNGIPFVFLTNGGGKSEAERAAELSRLLAIDIDPSVLVQSHTPFKTMLGPQAKGQAKGPELIPSGLQHQTVLVTGSNASKARKIATEYGFESVVTPGDILKACPEIFPFDPLAEFYDKQEVLPLPKPIYSPKNGPQALEDCLKIDAVLVFNDPRDWAVDIQLLLDLFNSHQGYLGTKASDFPKSHISPIRLVFSNRDDRWSTGYHLPRLGQGAFHRAVHAIVQAMSPYYPAQFFSFGKPFPIAYRYAESVLSAQLQKTLGVTQPLKRIYMVGDNPASDIAGANTIRNIRKKIAAAQMDTPSTGENTETGSFGAQWSTCLVKTGVWKENDGFGKNPKQKPKAIQDDVKSAVEWALKKEGRLEGSLG